MTQKRLEYAKNLCKRIEPDDEIRERWRDLMAMYVEGEGSDAFDDYLDIAREQVSAERAARGLRT